MLRYKYLKYINKTKQLLNQSGGDFFNEMFEKIVNFLFDFNHNELKKHYSGGELYSLFAFVKGGVSIKYHLSKTAFDHRNITNDIDIFLIVKNLLSSRDPDAYYIDKFVKPLKLYLKEYTVDLKYDNNGLYTICINGQCIIDLVVYKDADERDVDDGTSMINYAAKCIGYANIDSHIDAVVKSACQDIIKNPLNNSLELKEKITFTSIQFEYFSALKGIENTKNYIERIPIWKKELNELISEDVSNFMSYSFTEYQRLQQMKKRYEYMTSDKYIENLHNKHYRYTQKIEWLGGMLRDDQKVCRYVPLPDADGDVPM
jgi:hypothetical protein